MREGDGIDRWLRPLVELDGNVGMQIPNHEHLVIFRHRNRSGKNGIQKGYG